MARVLVKKIRKRVGQVETEGLAKTALAMGYQPYAMPFVEVVHK